MPDAPLIRPPRPGDGPRLAALAGMAMHGMGDVERIKEHVAGAEGRIGDVTQVETSRGPVRVLASVRVMDQGGEAVGLSYCCPPMDWILRDSRPPSFGVAQRVAAALVEIELVAVLPRWRRRGLAGRLLADCEQRYRDAGYRVALVIAEDSVEGLVPWYERRGYQFTRVDEPAYVRWWGNRDVDALYGAVTPSQRIGLKALAEQVSVKRSLVEAPIWRRTREYLPSKGATASGLFPVKGRRAFQSLLQVTGVLG